MFVSVGAECGFSHFEGTSEIHGISEIHTAENVYVDQVSL